MVCLQLTFGGSTIFTNTREKEEWILLSDERRGWFGPTCAFCPAAGERMWTSEPRRAGRRPEHKTKISKHQSVFY